MVGIRAKNLRLKYRLRRMPSLALRSPLRTGGNIEVQGNSTDIVALDGVSFTLTAGDRLGIVGSNGAGKTTLLKVLYGIYEPSGGHLAIDGHVDALFNIMLGFRPEASGRRNIILRGLINGWSEQEIERRMEDIIAFSELGDFIDVPFKTYSQGMAARLAFSVATCLEPQILLMDEWIGTGDAQFQDKAGKRMNELAEKAGIIVLASHNYAIIKRTCNLILELEKGRVKSFGSSQEWFDQKKN